MKPAEKIILAYIKGTASASQRSEVTRWAMESEENANELQALRKLYLTTIVNAPLKTSPKKRGRVILQAAYAISSAAAILVGIFLLIQKPWSDRAKVQEIYVPVGQVAQMTLADGSKVTLNSNSRLAFNMVGNKERRVKLNGEALFDVEKNPDCPFIVETPTSTVKVLGTVFSVTSYSSSETFDVKLFSGKVEVSDASGCLVTTLEPNQMLSYADGLYRKSYCESNAIDKWKQNIYAFNDCPFEDVVRNLANYYGVKILLKSEELASSRITCKFNKGDSIEHILSLLQEIHAFDFEIENNLITIL